MKDKKNKEIKEEIVEDKKDEKVELTKEEIEAINKKSLEQEEKIKELTEEALRAKAELVNYRKRKDEEVVRMLKYANEDLILEILPVLDNFERAIKMDDDNLDDEVSKFLSGVKMIYASLTKVLEKYGVKEIEALGKVFDENVHQAVMTESNDEKEKDVITEVYQKGYMLKDKLLRPAMVKVNK